MATKKALDENGLPLGPGRERDPLAAAPSGDRDRSEPPPGAGR